MGSFVGKISRTSAMASSPEVQQFIKEVVSGDKVVVFSKSYCPYCTLAKEFNHLCVMLFLLTFPILILLTIVNTPFVFATVKQPIKVIELDQRNDGDAIQKNLSVITGFKTVPQVFINGNCVGGGSDVKALLDSGKLEDILIG